MFDQFMNQTLTLVKKNSQRIEGVKASVQDNIYINDTSLPVEEGDFFEYTTPAGQNSYLKVEKVVYHEHSRMGHIEVEYVRVNNLKLVYLDTNVLGRVSDFRIKEEEANALKIIGEKNKQVIELFTSIKMKDEIEKITDNAKRSYQLFVYNLIVKIPSSNLIVDIPATIGSAPLGTRPLGGGSSMPDPLLTRLLSFFDEADAEHIFQAEKSNMDYFLTLDKKTIIDRIHNDPELFRRLGLRIIILLPSELIKLI